MVVDNKHNDIHTPWLNIEKLQKGSQSTIKHTITNHTAITVSNGSYSEILGIDAAPWIISTNNKQNHITVGSLSPGAKHIQSFYRKEILGLLGIIQELVRFCKNGTLHKEVVSLCVMEYQL